MARVTGPDFVALQVRDLEASGCFYEERLGLGTAAHSPLGAVVFRSEPIPFMVREPAVDLDMVERPGWGVALWLRCDDTQGLYDSLHASGVEIVQTPFDGPFERTFSLVDPDGYVVTVHCGG
jgi:predicted enzyme related to lactoylglutathione lyase